ncbi:MAG: arginine--tRNA ligase [Pseudomonadota bacterium]
MNIFKDFDDKITATCMASIAGISSGQLAASGKTCEAPRDPAHGDLSTNVAMVLAKPAGMKPREIAEMLVPRMREYEGVAAVEIAGPGFINLRLTPAYWHRLLAGILLEAPHYGVSSIGAGLRVNIEYVSANPTGPMHVGHTRGAVFGDALANLMQTAGYEVCREYYINDAGAQVDVLARSAFLRYREALGEDIGEIPEGLYPGDYLIPVGQQLKSEYGDSLRAMPEAHWLHRVRDAALKAMMALIREDLAALGIRHDEFYSERALHESGAIEKTLAHLESQGLIYVGVLEPPKGKTPDDWEPRPQTLFRASQFGDDVDRALKKSDGSWTYFAPDIAYHYDKFQRGYAHMIDVFGADHGGYVKRMTAAIAALTGGKGEIDVKICQLVRLLRNGEQIKMSKRSGNFVTLREVVDEVGRDAVRFMMLYRKNDAPLDFDFAKVTEQSKDNPVFYVQYAHARICSVLRNAADIFPGLAKTMAGEAPGSSKRDEGVDLSPLVDPDELALIRLMAGWPRMVETAAQAHEPHRIAFFAHDMASAFHALWNKGNENPQLRFIVPEQKDVTLARLALIRAAREVIAGALKILGVTPVEEMR